jgi:hypothetical protein
MRPRCGYCSRVLLLALAASLLASCATSPPRREDTPAILEIRDDYIRTHPDGAFNVVIARGEVAVGMGYYDMLAAWGIPDVRERDAERDEERWVYVLTSENQADWLRYDFIFAKRMLVEWEWSRGVASGSVPLPDDPRGISARVPATSGAALGDAPKKGSLGNR